MKTFVGIDISKASVDIAVTTDRPKHFVLKHYPSNTAQTAMAILADLPTSEVHVVLEATGTYGHRLATAFFEAGVPVSMVNPLCIKHFAQMRLKRAKTDRYDAKTIAAYGRAETLTLWQPRAPEREKLRQVVKAIEDLNVIRTELTNRQEAYSKLPVQSEVCQAHYARLVAEVEASLKSLKKELKTLSQQADAQAMKLLLSIPGIGPGTAGVLVAYYGQFEDFETASQVVAFAGLNPSVFQSGTSVRGRGGLSKRGHASIRCLLYMGALSAIRFNPLCKALYDRLLAKGKAKRVALVAVAHKLLRIAFGVVKGGRPYNPNFAKN
ncbi:MAG: IS110 family transposase [Candidatus Sericytochromatia bacterium]